MVKSLRRITSGREAASWSLLGKEIDFYHLVIRHLTIAGGHSLTGCAPVDIGSKIFDIEDKHINLCATGASPLNIFSIPSMNLGSEFIIGIQVILKKKYNLIATASPKTGYVQIKTTIGSEMSQDILLRTK